MTTAKPRRRYAGGGVPLLPAGRGPQPLDLPGADAATLLPEPLAFYERLFAQLVAARGPDPASPPARARANLHPRDIRQVANFITLALRNDLPTVEPEDAAVIWEKWRQAVADLRNVLRGVAEGTASQVANIVLDHRMLAIHDDLATALRAPRQVFERYCPWRTGWATFARLHPEAV